MSETQTPELRARLTLAEVADFERVSTETVRRWVRAAKLPAIRQGRQCIVRREDLLEFERRRFR